MKDEEIINKLKEAAKEGRIPCALVFKMAKENNISLKQIGDLLNQEKIKIAQCQLGCF